MEDKSKEDSTDIQESGEKGEDLDSKSTLADPQSRVQQDAGTEPEKNENQDEEPDQQSDESMNVEEDTTIPVHSEQNADDSQKDTETAQPESPSDAIEETENISIEESRGDVAEPLDKEKEDVTDPEMKIDEKKPVTIEAEETQKATPPPEPGAVDSEEITEAVDEDTGEKAPPISEEPPQVEEKEEFTGELELAILKDLKEDDKQAYKEEISENKQLEKELNDLKQLTGKVPQEVQKLEKSFEEILNKSKFNEGEKTENGPVEDANEPEAPKAEQEMETEQEPEAERGEHKSETPETAEITTGGEDEEKTTEPNATEESSQIPEELQTNLSNRQESLDLCLKMLKRLDRLFPQFTEIHQKAKNIPELKPTLRVNVAKFKKMKKTDFEQETQLLKKNLEEIRNHNYHLLRQKRDLVHEIRNFYYSFFQRYFFPIIDGLDSGKKFFNQEEWNKKFPDHEDLITQRAAIYDSLISRSDKFLAKFHIEQIPVARGDEFNEQKHDPFMVEEDAELRTNQIKEVNQKGFQFVDRYLEEPYIIRAPQVVVVKN
ncbi:MAG: nucleotide exchange factor GrpE [bacterium]